MARRFIIVFHFFGYQGRECGGERIKMVLLRVKEENERERKERRDRQRQRNREGESK